MIIYLAIGEIDYEMRPVIGVEESLEAAVARCVRTPRTEYGGTPFDRWWIEEWIMGAVTSRALYEVNTTVPYARKLDG